MKSEERLKFVTLLAELRDALTSAAESIEKYIRFLEREEFLRWNPERIKWVEAEGPSGPYERAEAQDNPDFQAMLKDLEKHNGRLTKGGYFYWKFEKAEIVGRKKRG